MTPTLECLEAREALALFQPLPVGNSSIFLRQPLGVAGVFVADPALNDEVAFALATLNPLTFRPATARRPRLGVQLAWTDLQYRARVVVAYDPSLPAHVAGEARPAISGSGFTIGPTVVAINPNLKPGVSEKWVVVHEIGHALGLAHPRALNPAAVDCVMQGKAQQFREPVVSYDMAVSLHTLYLRPKFQGEYRDNHPHSEKVFVRR